MELNQISALNRNSHMTKRKFASPLALQQDSGYSDCASSDLPKVYRCTQSDLYEGKRTSTFHGARTPSSQPEAKRYSSQRDIKGFSSPLIVKPGPWQSTSASNLLNATDIPDSTKTKQDQRCEVPSTPQLSSRTVRNVNRRLFHNVAEKTSQLSNRLSSAKGLTTPQSSLLRSARDVHIGKSSSSNPRDFSKSSGRTPSASRQSIHDGLISEKSLRVGSENGNQVGIKLASSQDQGFWRPVRGSLALQQSDTRFECTKPSHDVSQSRGGFREVTNAIIRNGRLSSQDASRQSINDEINEECLTRIAPFKCNFYVPEVWEAPDTLHDINSLTACSWQIFVVSELAANSQQIDQPLQSTMELGLSRDYIMTIRTLLIPNFLPLACQLELMATTVLAILLESYEAHLSSYSARDISKEEFLSAELNTISRVLKEESRDDCEIISPSDFYSKTHERLPCDSQRTDHTVIDSDIVSPANSHTELRDEYNRMNGRKSASPPRGSNKQLSLSNLYDAQIVEFRHIWSSKQLQMAEVAGAYYIT